MKQVFLVSLILFLAVFGSVGQLQAVDIYPTGWTASGPITSFSYLVSGQSVGISGTLTGLSPVDIVVPMLFGGIGPQYNFTIDLVNGTSLDWTDFHFETGGGTGASYETSSGQDTPLFLTNISKSIRGQFFGNGAGGISDTSLGYL